MNFIKLSQKSDVESTAIIATMRNSMRDEQALLLKPSVDDILPFDPAILAGQLRPSSIAMYRRDLGAYLAYAEGQGLDALAAATFARWRTALAQEAPLSPHTINRMLSAVKRLMREAAEQGYVSHELAASFQDRKGVQVRARKRALEAPRAHAHQPGGHAPPL